MKVLVIGGMHGNEPLGLAVVEQLRRTPINSVDTLIANDEAVRATVRFTGEDLNRSFPGSLRSKRYEQRRAAEILKITKNYDVVLDFHNTHCPDNDCGFVGDGASEQLFNTASFLGLPRVIVADYDCINKYALNCLSVEVSLDSPVNSVEVWCERIRQLAVLDTAPVASDVEKYRFVYRMTIEDRDRLALPTKGLRAFQPLEPKIATELGVISPAYPIFVGDAYTPYNYGGVLNRIELD